MPSHNLETGFTSSIDLHPKLNEDPDVHEALARLQLALKRSANAHGVSGEIRLLLASEDTYAGTRTPVHHAATGGSPGDWYEHEDQMTHGGKGKNGNWIQD